MSVTAYIGFGSNLGDPLHNLKKTKAALQAEPTLTFLQSSQLYETEPLTVDQEDQPWYLNAVFEVQTTLTLHSLLSTLKNIEKKLGRKSNQRWAARVVDLDILFYGDVVYADKEICIPHKELIHRKFVLKPLCDLIPDFIHPDLHMNLKDILQNTPDPLKVKSFKPKP